MATAKKTTPAVTNMPKAPVQIQTATLKSGVKKAVTKADLEEQVKFLQENASSISEARRKDREYSEKLFDEKTEFARKNADLLKQQQGLMETQVELQSLVSGKVAEVEKLLGEQKHLKQSNDTYASQNEKLWKEKERLEADNKRLDAAAGTSQSVLKAARDHADYLQDRLNKVPTWIRWFFNA